MDYATEQELLRLWRKIKCLQPCLGISPNGDPTLYLNQQGNWTVPAGGGSFTCDDVNDCLGISDGGSATLFLNEQGNFVAAGGALTFDNGLTETAGNVQLGGTLIQDTAITGTFTDIATNYSTGDNLPLGVFPGITVDGFLHTVTDSTNTIATVLNMGRSNLLAPMQLSLFNTSNGRNGRLAFNSNLVDPDETNFLLGVGDAFSTGLFYGVEGHTEREEVNLYITDQGVDDIGRINLGVKRDFSDAWYNMYIPDVTTYVGTSVYGIISIDASEADGIVLGYKNQRNGYVYSVPEQDFRSFLIVKDTLVFNKPAIGDVFTIGQEGVVTTTSGEIKKVRTANYGSPINFVTTDYHLALTGAGTGGTTIDISAMAIGQIAIISDLDRKSAANNITIDSGGGSTIVTQVGAAQTHLLALDGISVTIQKITATQYMVISIN